MHNIFENAYFGKAYKTKLNKPNHFDYGIEWCEQAEEWRKEQD